MVAAGEEALKFRHVTSIYGDDRGLGLKHPEGVACNQGNLIIVADTGNGRLLQYTYKDKTVAEKVRIIKLAQLVYPGADLSEQISTAGKEASGTGNMDRLPRRRRHLKSLISIKITTCTFWMFLPGGWS